MAAPRLQSARLVLRPPEAGDAPALAALANDFDVLRMTTRMPHPYTLADAQAFLGRCADADPRREATWAIAALERPTEPLGVLGFFTDDSFAPEIGYWLGRPAWSRGYATEAVAAAVGWADAVWRKPCLIAGCFVDNPASMAVLRKCGFLDTGVVSPRFSLARNAVFDCRHFIRVA